MDAELGESCGRRGRRGYRIGSGRSNGIRLLHGTKRSKRGQLTVHRIAFGKGDHARAGPNRPRHPGGPANDARLSNKELAARVGLAPSAASSASAACAGRRARGLPGPRRPRSPRARAPGYGLGPAEAPLAQSVPGVPALRASLAETSRPTTWRGTTTSWSTSGRATPTTCATSPSTPSPPGRRWRGSSTHLIFEHVSKPQLPVLVGGNAWL